MTIRVEAGFDGANPHEPRAIQQVADDHFRVYPFSEDGDGNYKFGLNVRAVNDAPIPAPFLLEVEWADLEYMGARGFVFAGGGDDWTFIPARVAGSVATVRAQIAPGATHFGLSPAYGLGDYETYADGLPRLGYRRREIGRSDQGRPIDAFDLGTGSRNMLIVGRYHPYETAASFCLEGLLTWLAAPGREQAKLVEGFHFTVVPMPNPDGVFMGLCKRTGLKGSDLSHEGARGEDAPSRALLALMDELRPNAMLDIHGWMHLDDDGLNYTGAGYRDRFVALQSAHPLLKGNVWLGEQIGDAPSEGSLAQHLRHRFGTEELVPSFRWIGRTASEMREIGAATLRAACAALKPGQSPM